MTADALTIAARTMQDQHDAARATAERVWPHNAHLINDPRVDAAVFEGLRSSIQASRPGQGFLIWPCSGAAEPMELDPDTDLLELGRVVRDTAPPFGAPCDLCRRPHPTEGHLLLAAPPHIIALVVCERCADDLNRNYRPRPQWT